MRLLTVWFLFLLQLPVFSQLNFSVSSSSGSFSLTCLKPSFTINASSNYSATVNYTFYTPAQTAVFGNSLSITANPGMYTVVASSGSVTAMQTFLIIENKNAPTISISTGSVSALTCKNPTLVMTGIASPSTALLFWPPASAGFGCVDYTCVAAVPGLYSLTATDSVNGCMATATLLVEDRKVYPHIRANDVFTMTCPNGTVSLQAFITNSLINLSYLWQSPDGLIIGDSTSSTLLTQATGIYTVNVTNNLTGCMSRELLYVYACVGLEKEQVLSPEVYPNPFSSGIRIKNFPALAGGYSAEVCDALGQVLLRHYCTQRDCLINLEMLGNGIYYLVLRSSETPEIRAFLKLSKL